MSKIKVYTNESVNVAVSEGLQRRGVEALSSRDAGNLGLTDEEQLTFANERHMAIFTHDTDFLRISTKWVDEGKTHHGIIYCHQMDYSIGDCIRRLKILTTILAPEDMINHIEFL